MTEPTDAIRARHVPQGPNHEMPPRGTPWNCYDCQTAWPCDVVRLAEAYEAQLAEAQRRIAALERIAATPCPTCQLNIEDRKQAEARLTVKQQRVLDAINNGIVAHYMPYMGPFNENIYWYLCGTTERCTQAVERLIKLNLVSVMVQEQDKFGTRITAVRLVKRRTGT